MSTLDDHEVSITCDKCGSKYSKTVREINLNPEIVCPGCGHRLKTEGARTTLKKAGDAVDGLSKTISDLNRKQR